MPKLGTRKCRKTKEEFIAQIQAKEGPDMRGDSFPYPLTQSLIKMRVVCRVHGEYEIVPASRVAGSRCAKCWKRGQPRQTKEEFLAKLVAKEGPEMRGDTFPNPLPLANEKMVVVCKVHGKYQIRPGLRMYGQRCKKCWDNRRVSQPHSYSTKGASLDDILKRIESLKEEHPKTFEFLDFTKSQITSIKNINPTAKGGRAVMSFVCHCVDPTTGKEHGKQWRALTDIYGTVAKKVKRPLGCNKCKPTTSEACREWLESIEKEEGIDIQRTQYPYVSEYIIPGTSYRVDGFHAPTKRVFEYNDDASHGNPIVYKNAANKTAKQQFASTIRRENELRNLGYNVVVKWETPISPEVYAKAIATTDTP